LSDAHIGEPSLLLKLMPKSKKSVLKFKNDTRIEFLEIGSDDDHVHFLVQSVPMYSPKQIVQTIKSITAREVFKACPQVKQYLWGGKFWSDGYARQHSRRASN
jgi:REP element-mobilizing transposase RayT